MNNGLSQSLSLLWQHRLVRLFVLLGTPLLLLIIIVAIALQPKELVVKNTGVDLSSHMAIVDGNIVAYNGTSFYRIDPYSKEPARVIYTPNYRLPTPSFVLWSKTDLGVLLNFQTGFMYSPLANQAGFSQNGTWYLSFTDGSLAKVDDSELFPGLAFYSNERNGFYYSPNNGENSQDSMGVSTLKFYDIKTKKSHLVSNRLGLIVSSIAPCTLGEERVCLMGRRVSESYGKTDIYSVLKDGSINTVKTFNGEVYKTPVVDTFIALLDGKPQNEVETAYSKVVVYDAKSNKESSYVASVVGGSVLVGLKGSDFYLLDGSNNESINLSSSVFSSAQTSLIKLQDDQNLILPSNAQNDSKTTLIAATDKKVYALSGSDQPQLYTVASADAVAKAVQVCANSSQATADHKENSFIVYINDNDNFLKNLSAIKTCIASDVKNLYGYTFTYRGISEFNGRITTD